MKAMFVILIVFVAMTSLAQTNSPPASPTNSFKSAAEIAPWPSRNDIGHWERVLREPSEDQSVKLGKSDAHLSGPLVQGLQRKPSPPDASLGRRLLGLPVVRLFVPQPIPSPQGGGGYFRWGESEHAWTTVAVTRAPGAISNPEITHEPQSALVQVSFGK